MCCLRLSKMRVLLSLLHSPYTRLCWQLAAEPQTTATAVLLHAGMTLMMKDRHRRVSFAWADSARGRLGGGAGGLAADAARRKRLPPIVHEGRRWHQRTQFTHSPPSPVTRQPASSIMHFGRACKFHSSFGLGRPQPPLQQLPSRTLLSLRCCQSLVLTGPSQGKIHGSCNPYTRTAAFRAHKRCCPRNPCTGSSPFHARKCCCPRNPCIFSSPFHARKCQLLHNPCICSCAFHARKCRCPRNPCICSSPFHARDRKSTRLNSSHAT